MTKKLKEVRWERFKLEELFEIVGTKSLDSNAVEFVINGINFVGRTFENNGIQGKIEKQKFEPNNSNTITATVIGNYKYVKLQKEPYYCSQNINKLTPKEVINIWNEKIAYFFVANIQKFVSLYDGQQSGYKLEDIKKHEINLPIKNDGSIDFEFITCFISELEARQISELEAYLVTTGLSDYVLNFEEKKILEIFRKDEIEWKEFKIVDLFEVKNSGNILSRDVVLNSGKIPYLSASRENNAVNSYISYDKKYLDKGNCVFIGGKTFVVTYQKNDFYSNDSHNLALYFKDENQKTKLKQLFFVSCIEKSLSNKYSWGNSISNKKIQNDTLKLPVINRKIDFEFMEILISAIQKIIIKDVVLYSNKKIEATKKLVFK